METQVSETNTIVLDPSLDWKPHSKQPSVTVARAVHDAPPLDNMASILYFLVRALECICCVRQS